MDILQTRANQIKALIDLVDQREYPLAFRKEDVDEIISDSSSELDKLRALGRMAAYLHEVLYAPPKQ